MRKSLKKLPELKSDNIKKPDNKIYFYPGRRKLMPVPWIYKIPDLGFIKEENKQ